MAAKHEQRKARFAEFRARAHTDSAVFRYASRVLIERARELRLRSAELCRVNRAAKREIQAD